MNVPIHLPVSPRSRIILTLFALGMISAEVSKTQAAERPIRPGDSPQAILDEAQPGDRLVFLPGLHQHGLGKHRSILYVDKPVEIELKAGAILKLADGETKIEPTGEITTDQDSGKTLDDLEIGGGFEIAGAAVDGPEAYGATIYTIIIDGVGKDGQPDTFSWGDGKLFETPHRKIPVTGDWQELSRGVKARFGHRTGHSVRSLWFVSFDAPEAYGIRIGHGTQANAIENVSIFGRGSIDMNGSRNAMPSGLVKNINACVLVHGRVRDVRIEGITMIDTMRSVMVYGEHTGEMLPGGKVGPGESFDVENVIVERTRTLNPRGAGYLFGHPSHRGRIRNLKCNHNDVETGMTAIEPNFQLNGFEIIGNVIKSDGQAIHCWRHSKNGTIADNLRVFDVTGKPVVVANSPRGWAAPDPPVLRNNRNHLSDPESK